MEVLYAHAIINLNNIIQITHLTQRIGNGGCAKQSLRTRHDCKR